MSRAREFDVYSFQVIYTDQKSIGNLRNSDCRDKGIFGLQKGAKEIKTGDGRRQVNIIFGGLLIPSAINDGSVRELDPNFPPHSYINEESVRDYVLGSNASRSPLFMQEKMQVLWQNEDLYK